MRANLVEDTIDDVEAFLKTSTHQLRVWYSQKRWHARIGLEACEGDNMLDAVRAVVAVVLSS